MATVLRINLHFTDKDLKLLTPESSIFTSLIVKECDASAIEDGNEDYANGLSEPITLLFNPCANSYTEGDLKDACNKSCTDYCCENPQIILNHLDINIRLTQTLVKNWKFISWFRLSLQIFMKYVRQ